MSEIAITANVSHQTENYEPLNAPVAFHYSEERRAVTGWSSADGRFQPARVEPYFDSTILLAGDNWRPV